MVRFFFFVLLEVIFSCYNIWRVIFTDCLLTKKRTPRYEMHVLLPVLEGVRTKGGREMYVKKISSGIARKKWLTFYLWQWWYLILFLKSRGQFSNIYPYNHPIHICIWCQKVRHLILCKVWPGVKIRGRLQTMKIKKMERKRKLKLILPNVL